VVSPVKVVRTPEQLKCKIVLEDRLSLPTLCSTSKRVPWKTSGIDCGTSHWGVGDFARQRSRMRSGIRWQASTTSKEKRQPFSICNKAICRYANAPYRHRVAIATGRQPVRTTSSDALVVRQSSRSDTHRRSPKPSVHQVQGRPSCRRTIVSLSATPPGRRTISVEMPYLGTLSMIDRRKRQTAPTTAAPERPLRSLKPRREPGHPNPYVLNSGRGARLPANKTTPATPTAGVFMSNAVRVVL